MQDVRCPKCRKLFFKRHKAHIDITGIEPEIRKQISSNGSENDVIEVKCDRCKEITKFEESIFNK